MTEVIADSARAAQLRGRLTDDMMVEGTIMSNEIEAAFRTVPRHLFAPGTTLEQSYAQIAVRTKRDQHDTTVSSISAPWLQAMMLEQAGLRPGMRVLEIGSGGYNAALIAELVGADGEVTTVDIDPDVVDRARSYLAEAGYSRVHVVLADAEAGVPQHAPYDRIVVTAGAWDIPPAWADQLTESGTITVWLATALDGYCRISVDPELDTGQVCPITRRSNDAAVDGDIFAYLAARRLDTSRAEFGVHAFGPGAATLAETMAEQVRVWDRDHRGRPGPHITVHPVSTPDEALPDGRVIDKRHARVTISWPSAGGPAKSQSLSHHTTLDR